VQSRTRIAGVLFLGASLALGGYRLFVRRNRDFALGVYSEARCLLPNAPELLSGQGQAWRYSMAVGNGEHVELEASAPASRWNQLPRQLSQAT
jgi:hypothetical protein